MECATTNDGDDDAAVTIAGDKHDEAEGDTSSCCICGCCI